LQAVCWDGEPCGSCDPCKEFGDIGRGFYDFYRFECGEHSTVEEVKGLLDIARAAPFIGNRRVLMLDEIQNLSRRAFDALLRIVESPPAWATFIFLTSKPEALLAALRSRLTHLELGLLTPETATRFLATICKAEGLAHDASGLALLRLPSVDGLASCIAHSRRSRNLARSARQMSGLL
jgi:DNA polymerase-3 subunit gamma/tau